VQLVVHAPERILARWNAEKRSGREFEIETGIAKFTERLPSLAPRPEGEEFAERCPEPEGDTNYLYVWNGEN
jgi:hypothetical protein